MWQTGGFLNTLMWFLLGYWVGIGMPLPAMPWCLFGYCIS